MAENDDKQKLYRRIVGISLHRVLDRMRAHGFWPLTKGLPPDPAEEAKRRAEIEKELETLRSQSIAGGQDKIDAALREERVRRWEASKKKRAERKAFLQAQHASRRAAWAQTRQLRVFYAGEGVSGGLGRVDSDQAKLVEHRLPVIHSGADLAAKLGITLTTLRWLTYHRRGATLVHYHRYDIAKKTGGRRLISAPKPKLAAAQQFIHEQILRKIATTEHAHGFVPFKSIVTNAAPHVGKKVVVNLDLKDFFPSVGFRRCKGLFESFGYGEEVATLLALLCTEPPRLPVTIEGESKPRYVALGERMVPQGACTSPMILNLVCRKLDLRLAGLAKRHGFSYTRYADDLTFSGMDDRPVGRLLRSVRSIVEAEGFREHEAKTKVMRRGARQEVTGVTVNDRLAVAREEVRTLRAILHNAKKHGLASQNRDNHPSFALHLRGRIAFVHMVDPQKASKLFEALERLT